MNTQDRRGEIEAQVSVAMDLSEKSLNALTISWKDMQGIDRAAYSLVALRRAAQLLTEAAEKVKALQCELRAEEDRAERSE